MKLKPGDTIGEYRILNVIANGGFSVVYRARDTNLLRTVAIKQLSPAAFSEEGTREWFIREAQLTASLAHPNIVQIYSLRDEGDLIFLVMEYLPSDLHELVQKHGPLDRARLLKVASDICRALETLHARNVIHRDIKPENILIGPEEQFKLADFGLAHVRQLHGAADARGPQPGTLLYMSPEQAFGRKVTPRSDIYSLAIVLYEAITGHYYFPFDEDDDDDDLLLDLIDNADPLPVDRHHPSVPQAIEEPLLRALSKDPYERPATAREFLADLKTAITRSKHATLSKKRRELAATQRPAAPPELQRVLYAIRTLRDAQHQPKQALRQMRALWEEHPGIPEVAAEWGETLVAAGRISEGRNWLEDAVHTNPDLPFAQLALADIYRNTDDNDEDADAATVQAIQIDPDLVYAVLYEDIVASLNDPDTYKHYVDLFRTAAADTPTAPVLHNLGQVLALDPEATRESLAVFQEALQRDPDYGPAALGLASLLIERQRIAEAIPLLETARYATFPTVAPDDWHKAHTVYQQVHAHLALAIAYAQVGQYENSAIAARAVLDLNHEELDEDAPALLEAYARAARAWLDEGHALRAYKFLNQVIPLASTWGSVEIFALLEEAQQSIEASQRRPRQWDDALDWLRTSVTGFNRENDSA